MAPVLGWPSLKAAGTTGDKFGINKRRGQGCCILFYTKRFLLIPMFLHLWNSTGLTMAGEDDTALMNFFYLTVEDNPMNVFCGEKFPGKVGSRY